jgi:hypothetical protein
MTRELIERMRAQLHVWEDCARFEEWSAFQREYAEAFQRIQSLSERIDVLEQALAYAKDYLRGECNTSALAQIQAIELRAPLIKEGD